MFKEVPYSAVGRVPEILYSTVAPTARRCGSTGGRVGCQKSRIVSHIGRVSEVSYSAQCFRLGV